jgi:hypothetical protein
MNVRPPTALFPWDSSVQHSYPLWAVTDGSASTERFADGNIRFIRDTIAWPHSATYCFRDPWAVAGYGIDLSGLDVMQRGIAPFSMAPNEITAAPVPAIGIPAGWSYGTVLADTPSSAGADSRFLRGAPAVTAGNPTSNWSQSITNTSPGGRSFGSMGPRWVGEVPTSDVF